MSTATVGFYGAIQGEVTTGELRECLRDGVWGAIHDIVAGKANGHTFSPAERYTLHILAVDGPPAPGASVDDQPRVLEVRADLAGFRALLDVLDGKR